MWREMCVQRSCLGTLRACQSSRVIPAMVCTPTLSTSCLSTRHAWSREPRKYRVDDRIRGKNSTWSLPDTVWGRKLYSSLLIGTGWRPNLTPQSFKPSSLRRAILAPDAKPEFITLKTTALCLLFAHVVCYKALKVTRLQEPADGGLEGGTGDSSPLKCGCRLCIHNHLCCHLYFASLTKKQTVFD